MRQKRCFRPARPDRGGDASHAFDGEVFEGASSISPYLAHATMEPDELRSRRVDGRRVKLTFASQIQTIDQVFLPAPGRFHLTAHGGDRKRCRRGGSFGRRGMLCPIITSPECSCISPARSACGQARSAHLDRSSRRHDRWPLRRDGRPPFTLMRSNAITKAFLRRGVTTS